MQAQQFEDFLDTVCSGIFSDRVRRRTRKELLDHLTCKAEDAVTEGMTESDAVAAALQCFGETGVVRAQITRAHRKDNLKTLGKGFGRFLLSLLATAFGLLVQVLIIVFAFVDDANIVLGGLLFFVLTLLTWYAARNEEILLPLCLIPAALVQCVYVFYEEPSFLIALPELLSGHLIRFLKDFAFGVIYSTPVAKGMTCAFILLFVVVNLLIAVSSFRLRTKRSKTNRLDKWTLRMSGILLTITVSASALCFCAVFVPGQHFLRYVSHYIIVPAADEAEVQDVLAFYKDKAKVRRDFTVNEAYPTEETGFYVYYHHDLDSASIDASAVHGGESYETDDTILVEDSHYLSSQDLFYRAYKSVVILAPEKTTGYYVAIPVIDDWVRTDKAKTIALPLKKDATIRGNMYQHDYEIILKQPLESEGTNP
ncbi:MAG: hypothetical protein IK080_00280 [Clostridia bacterium]|nr:hypothetical protein [Clostridia bacterium]